jgi:hypothetical protein
MFTEYAAVFKYYLQHNIMSQKCVIKLHLYFT